MTKTIHISLQHLIHKSFDVASLQNVNITVKTSRMFCCSSCWGMLSKLKANQCQRTFNSVIVPGLMFFIYPDLWKLDEVYLSVNVNNNVQLSCTVCVSLDPWRLYLSSFFSVTSRDLRGVVNSQGENAADKSQEWTLNLFLLNISQYIFIGSGGFHVTQQRWDLFDDSLTVYSSLLFFLHHLVTATFLLFQTQHFLCFTLKVLNWWNMTGVYGLVAWLVTPKEENGYSSVWIMMY